MLCSDNKLPLLSYAMLTMSRIQRNKHSRNQRKWVPKKYEKNKEEFAAKQNIKIQIRVGNSGGQHNQVQMCGQFLSDGRCVENNE